MTSSTKLSLACAVAVVGCAFEPRGPLPGSDGALPDDGRPADDAPPGGDAAHEDIHHVALAQEYVGDADVEIAASVTLDTSALAVTAGAIGGNDGNGDGGPGPAYGDAKIGRASCRERV